MRVGFDVRPLSSGHAWRGIGAYVRGLRDALTALAAPGLEVVPLGGHLESRLDRQMAFPFRTLRSRIAVLHVTVPEVPYWQPASTVVTLHDLIPLRFGDEAVRRAWRWRLMALRRAARVIVYSVATARDAVELAGVRSDRIRAIPNGVSDAFTPGPARSRDELPNPYLLYVGGLDARKNIAGLLRATARAVANCRGAGLVVVTQDPWAGWDAECEKLGLSDLVVVLRAEPDSEELARLYRGAAVYLSASRYEGFGFPLLEAMACGTPVVAFRHSSHPEIVQGGGLLVKDGDEEALAAAAASVLGDPSRRATLSAGALRNAARFSWARAADATLAIYRELCTQTGAGV